MTDNVKRTMLQVVKERFPKCNENAFVELLCPHNVFGINVMDHGCCGWTNEECLKCWERDAPKEYQDEE